MNSHSRRSAGYYQGNDMDLANLRAWLDFFHIRTFFHNNSPFKLIVIFGLIALLAIGAKFICAFFKKRVEKSVRDKFEDDIKKAPDKSKVQASMDKDIFEKLMHRVVHLAYALIIYWGLHQINFGPLINTMIVLLFTILCIWIGINFFTTFVPFNLDIYLRRHGTTLSTSQARSLLPIIKGIIWAIGLTILLDNIGVHVSTLIAGLGIVGVAVGLAGQAILSDFFSYIVILMDKPFKIGDFVVLGNGKSGEVIYMGPKTTRLLSLDNNIIVCANTEMTKGILENQGDVKSREVIIEVGVSFNVEMDKVRRVPEILREVVDSFPQCVFERACMTQFGSANYLFQLIYHVKPQKGGLTDFMNTQTEVNLALTNRLNNASIPGAYPTQTILLTQVQPAKPAASQPQA